jgi:hypothetical protein
VKSEGENHLLTLLFLDRLRRCACAQPSPVLPRRPQCSYATKADLRRHSQREDVPDPFTRRFLLDGGVQIRSLGCRS